MDYLKTTPYQHGYYHALVAPKDGIATFKTFMLSIIGHGPYKHFAPYGPTPKLAI